MKAETKLREGRRTWTISELHKDGNSPLWLTWSGGRNASERIARWKLAGLDCDNYSVPSAE